jgi:phosphoglycolate phosphatase-like HAD superfamily hydrolase
VVGGPETDAGRGEAGVLGLPEGVIAGLFDLDGVLTNTAAVHNKAWTEMFDAFLRERAEQTGESFVAFDPSADYSLYVDGKPRPDGVRDFLASRGIRLPEASRLHLLPLGRVALHLITVSGRSAQRSSECDRLLPVMIDYLRSAGNLAMSASLLAAGSFRLACASSYLLLVGAILATSSACCL